MPCILVVELGLTGLTSTSRSIRTTCAKSFALLRSSDSVLNVRLRILVVELELTGLTSTSRSIRTTCAKSFALLRSSDSVLNVRPRILVVELGLVAFAFLSDNYPQVLFGRLR